MEDRGGYIWVPWQEWLYDSNGVVNPRWGISQPAPYLVKHHTPGIDPGTYSAAVEALNGVWYYHSFVAEGGWGWIGYNTLGWGRFIFEGAGIGNRGIHAPGANGISHGHAFLLDSRIRQPTQEEWSALRAFAADLISWGNLHPAILVPGASLDGTPRNSVHHDWVATTCAGPGVDESSQRFYNTTPNPNPDPNPIPNRRKGGRKMFQPRVNLDGSITTFPAGLYGMQWGSRAFDAPVPAGYKIGVSPGQQNYRTITVKLIVNGNAKAPVDVSEGTPYFFEVTSDSFVTILVSPDVVPIITVG